MVNPEAISHIDQEQQRIEEIAQRGAGVAQYSPQTDDERIALGRAVDGWGFKSPYMEDGTSAGMQLYSEGLAAITDAVTQAVTLYGPTPAQLREHAKSVLTDVKNHLP